MGRADKVQVATSFKEYCRHIVKRCKFVRRLTPCRAPPRAQDVEAASQLAARWSHELPATTLRPLLRRWKSSEHKHIATGRWGVTMSVLRRQHSWAEEEDDVRNNAQHKPAILQVCVCSLLLAAMRA